MHKHSLTSIALLAFGLGASGIAAAAISPGDGAAGNPPGEIFYTVWDPAAQVSYTRDTGISVLDFLANPGQGFSFAPDQLYTDTFGSIDPSTLVYGVGGFNARFDDFPCCYGMVISSDNDPAQVTLPDFTALFTALSTGGFYARGANGNDGGDPNDFTLDLSSLSEPGDSGYYDGENWGGNIGLTVPFQTGATVGVELLAYSLLLNADGIGIDTAAYSKFLLAADGTFSYAGTVVPIPAGVWLLGSALIGLAARRRRG